MSNLRTALLSLAILVLPSIAQAGYIRLTGVPTIRLTEENGMVRLSGSYPLENQGDEIAVNVYPTLAIGNFSWAGQPRSLSAGEGHEWNIEATIDAAQIGCEKDALCAGQQLPVTGSLPLLSRIHYQDANNYPFSAAQVLRLDIGGAPPTGSIQGKLMMSGDGESFKGRLSVQNASLAKKKVSVSLFSSREILIKTSPFVMEIPEYEIASSEVAVQNFKGIHGSMYPIHAILQWEENGQRQIEVVFDNIKLARPDKKLPLVVGLIALGLFSVALLWLTVFRKKRAAR